MIEDLQKVHASTVRIGEMSIEGQKLRRYEKEYFIYADNDEKRNKYIGEWTEARNSLKDRIVGIGIDQSGTWSAQDKREAAEWNRVLDFYANEMIKVDNNVKSGQISGTLNANTAIGDGKNTFRAFLNGSAEALNERLNRTTQLVNEYETLTAESNRNLQFIFVAGVALALILILLIPQRINSQIAELDQAVTAISKGALNTAVPTRVSPELARLAKSVERLRVSLKGLLARARRGSGVQ